MGTDIRVGSKAKITRAILWSQIECKDLVQISNWQERL